MLRLTVFATSAVERVVKWAVECNGDSRFSWELCRMSLWIVVIKWQQHISKASMHFRLYSDLLQCAYVQVVISSTQTRVNLIGLGCTFDVHSCYCAQISIQSVRHNSDSLSKYNPQSTGLCYNSLYASCNNSRNFVFNEL